MDYYTSMLTSMLSFLGVFTVGTFGVYFLLILLLGMMFYFFTGDKKPGMELLRTMMRNGTRLYAQTWMFVSMLGVLVGSGMFVKGILGLLAPDFVYITSKLSTSVPARDNDLKLGIVLVVVFLIIFLVHWVFAYLVETAEEKKGTPMTKMFYTAGMFISSFVVFGSLLTFVLDLVNSASGLSTKPGASLAMLLGAFPIWAYYAVRGMMAIRHEK